MLYYRISSNAGFFVLFASNRTFKSFAVLNTVVNRKLQLNKSNGNKNNKYNERKQKLCHIELNL